MPQPRDSQSSAHGIVGNEGAQPSRTNTPVRKGVVPLYLRLITQATTYCLVSFDR